MQAPATKPAIRRVFITGASSGIGAALAQHYAAQGAVLGLAGRNRERLMELGLAGQSRCYVLDVRDAEALQRAAEDFMQHYGTPDLVIANAGVSRGTLTELAEDIPAFQAIMDINVLGMMQTFQPFIHAMKDAGHGQLVGIASVAGLRGLPGSGAYSASKAAAIAYLESLRVELLGSGIHVTTICPGYIRTPMTDVNTFPMPFLMEIDDAAKSIARIIQRRKRFAIFPWQMSVIGRLMKLIPAPVWDWAMKQAPRKPRASADGL
jgi:NAD(P)-dependent dehydrogenase (short-subunit alcohol dehydrogenase family)